MAEDITLLIPGSDPELLPLTLDKDRLEASGIQVLVSSLDVIRIVRNILETYRLVAEIPSS